VLGLSERCDRYRSARTLTGSGDEISEKSWRGILRGCNFYDEWLKGYKGFRLCLIHDFDIERMW